MNAILDGSVSFSFFLSLDFFAFDFLGFLNLESSDTGLASDSRNKISNFLLWSSFIVDSAKASTSATPEFGGPVTNIFFQ